MIKKKALWLVSLLVIVVGCAPYVSTQMDNKIIVPSSAERKVFIQTDPRETELILIVKPLEEKLTSKGYTLVDTPDQASYTMRLHLTLFALRGYIYSGNGSAMQTGMTGGALAASSASAAFGFGVGSLLSGGPSGVPFLGEIDVSISGQSMTQQKTTIYAEAKVYHKNQIISAQEAVAHALAKKIAAMMP